MWCHIEDREREAYLKSICNAMISFAVVVVLPRYHCYSLLCITSDHMGT